MARPRTICQFGLGPGSGGAFICDIPPEEHLPKSQDGEDSSRRGRCSELASRLADFVAATTVAELSDLFGDDIIDRPPSERSLRLHGILASRHLATGFAQAGNGRRHTVCGSQPSRCPICATVAHSGRSSRPISWRRERGDETLAEIGRSYNVSGWTIFAADGVRCAASDLQGAPEAYCEAYCIAPPYTRPGQSCDRA